MAGTELSQSRVLVVDDDLSNRALLEVILEGAGIGQVRLEAGDTPLDEVVDEFQPNVVLLDLHLAAVHGFDVLRVLAQRDAGWAERRVVVLTGETDAGVRAEALELGAAEVVTKPYDPSELVEILARLLGNEPRPRAGQVDDAPRAPVVSDGANVDFQALFERSPDPFVVLDAELVVVAASDEYLRVTRGRREEVVGRPLLDAFEHNANDPTWPDVRRQAEESFERVRRDLCPDAMAVKPYDMRQADGTFETRWWSPASWPVLDGTGKLRWILHRLEDVTELVRVQHQAEQQRGLTSELEEQTARMQVEVMRRAQQIEETNRELQKANAAKREFLSRMSHELRTPLTSILGFSELLAFGDLATAQAKYVQAIRHAGRHLLELINEVLDLSRIETGHLALDTESVPVESLVSDVHGLLQPVAVSHDVLLEGGSWRTGKGYVQADRQRLRQVLINLTANAIKYNVRGGRVWTVVEERPDDRIRISVHDTGPGLSTEDQNRLFVPFERLAAGNSDTEGTGLGLALSRELAEAMGGELGVVSEIDVGSTFWIELPAAEPAALVDSRAEVPEVRVRGYSRPRTILYVEDLVANVQLVESILLWRPDVRLIPAMLGEMALDLAREHRPDLVLLDLHLPDMGGDEVLARLRKDRVTSAVPIVVFSADATSRLTEEMLRAGASNYLTKPIGVRELLEALDHALGED